MRDSPLIAPAKPSSDGTLGSGWRTIIIICGFLGLSAGYSSTYLYTAGLFILPISAEFGLTRGQVSLGPLFCTLAAAVVTPVLGSILDRFGALVVALGSLLGLGVGFLLLGRYSDDLHSYVGLSVLLAVLGSGSTGLVFSRLVLSTFGRRRGLSLGIVMTGSGFGALLIPPALMPVIQEHGWRVAYQNLSFLPFGAAIILGLLLVPIWHRLEPRITDPRPARGVANDNAATMLWRSPLFWAIGGLFFLLAIASVGYVVHFVPMLIDAGTSPLAAARTAGLIGLAAIAGRLVIGYCLDRFAVERLAIVVIIIALLSCALMYVDAVLFGPYAALALGFVMGAESDLLPFFVLRYFPKNRYGTMFGGIFGLFLVGGAIGPALIGYSHGLSHSYNMSLLIIISVFLLSLGATTVLKRLLPESKDRQRAATTSA